ncbi:MAG: hypothetical protein K6E35_06125, partial [Bacteroidales bacterium]|nr:hypothetical protein [Bacteroidales bacterium]
FVQYAGQLIMHAAPTTKTDGQATVVQAAAAANELMSIEFTESGVCAIGEMVNGQPTYTSSTYSVEGNVYTIPRFGKVEFDNTQSDEVQVTIMRDGSEPISGPATFKRPLDTDKLYRGWTVEKTRVSVKGWTSAAADFVGCNFFEIVKFLRNNNHKVPDDITPSMGLQSISFTGTGSIIFAYTDGRADVGTYKYNGSSCTYRWNSDKMGFTFLTEDAEISYMDGKCILTISANIQNSTTSGSVTFVLAPMV